jgi:hypothetical protein
LLLVSRRCCIDDTIDHGDGNNGYLEKYCFRGVNVSTFPFHLSHSYGGTNRPKKKAKKVKNVLVSPTLDERGGTTMDGDTQSSTVKTTDAPAAEAEEKEGDDEEEGDEEGEEDEEEEMYGARV